MIQEQKDLLLKELCARQMNGVKCKVFNDAKSYILSGVLHNKPYRQLYFDELDWKEFDGFVSINDCKPYLFPLSSMMEEQYYEMQNCSSEDCLDHMETLKSLRECTDFTHWPLYEYRVIDWFNKNHFDYRGLIPMGLAIDATGLNIY